MRNRTIGFATHRNETVAEGWEHWISPREPATPAGLRAFRPCLDLSRDFCLSVGALGAGWTGFGTKIARVLRDPVCRLTRRASGGELQERAPRGQKSTPGFPILSLSPSPSP